ncbi:hypothetical protein FRB99_004932 [Tulasnella sp. 403]|nr:hypothetical protein FRB99_004932 [Tulasnella sp. 403]
MLQLVFVMRFLAAISILTALTFGVSSFAAPTKANVDFRPIAKVAPRHNGGRNGSDKAPHSLPEILDLTQRRVVDIIPELREIFPIVKPPKPHPIDCERAWHLVSRLNTTIFEGSRAIQRIRHLPLHRISGGLSVSDVAYKAVGLTTRNLRTLSPGEPTPEPFNLNEILNVVPKDITKAISEFDKIIDEVVNAVVEAGNVDSQGVNAMVNADFPKYR